MLPLRRAANNVAHTNALTAAIVAVILVSPVSKQRAGEERPALQRRPLKLFAVLPQRSFERLKRDNSKSQNIAHLIPHISPSFRFVQWVSTLFFGAGDSASAARLNDINARLTDEIKHAEDMIPSAPDQWGVA